MPFTAPFHRPLTGSITRALAAPGTGAGGSPDFTVAPTFAIYSIDNLESDGRVVPNRYASTPPSGNIIALSTGFIRPGGGGAVVTNFFANGPGGALTATRLEMAADATECALYSGAPTAGNYTFTFKAKLNAGGPTKNVRVGDSIPGYVTVGLNDTTWTTVTVTNFAASGTTYNGFSILPAVGTAPLDVLVDEIQWYPASETIPNYADESWDWHFKVRNKGYTNAITRSGNLLDNNAGGAVGDVVAPTFPAATTFSEITVMVAFKLDTIGLSTMVVTEVDAALGTTANTLQLGFNAGTGILGQVSALPLNYGTSRLEPAGQGWHIYASRTKNGNRQTYFNGVEINTGTTAWAGFDARLLKFGGASVASASKGEYGVWAVWDSYLSDADLAAAHRKIEADIVAMGEVRGDFPNFYFAEGDSITANSFTTANGPGFPYLLAAAGEFVGGPPLYMRNRAVSGSGIATLETRKPVLVNAIGQAIAAGANPVVTVLIGTNDTAEIGASGYLAYYAKLASYWADLRAAGAKVVACTLLPANVGNPAWDAERALLNAYIRTQTSAYDALADLAADPDIGPDAAPAALVYYYDTIHLNGAGHAIAKGIVKTALTTVMV